MIEVTRPVVLLDQQCGAVGCNTVINEPSSRQPSSFQSDRQSTSLLVMGRCRYLSRFFQVCSVFGIGISKYRDICSVFSFFREIYSSCFGVLSKQKVQLFATQHIRFVNAYFLYVLVLKLLLFGQVLRVTVTGKENDHSSFFSAIVCQC